MATTKRVETMAEYLKTRPPAARKVLAQVRAAIRKAVPRAEEGISYQMPVVRLDGRMLLYYAGWKKHWSIYPATGAVRDVLGDQLEGRVVSRGTIQFQWDEPLPTKLIAAIARVRASEVEAALAAKKKPKKQG